jgi:tetratricopeptide (TPR) repeat protein
MRTALTIQTPPTLLKEAWAEMKRARAEKDTYDLAEFMCLSALHDAEAKGEPLAPAQHALANVTHWKGDYKQASYILDLALKEAMSDELNVQISNLLIAVLSADGRSKRACDVALKLSPLVEALDVDAHTAQFLRNYGDALNRLNEVDPAIERYTGAIINYEKVGDFRRCSDVRNNLACLLIKKEKFEEAHEQIKSALSFFHSDEEAHRSALGQVYETLAQAYEAEDELDEAHGAITRSLSYLVGGEESELIRVSRETHGRILDKMGLERVVNLLCAPTP